MQEGATREGLRELEQGSLAKVIEWQRLTTVLGEHITALEKDYPLQDVSRLRRVWDMSGDAAEQQVRLTTEEVQECREQIRRREAGGDKQRSKKCAVM